MSVGIAAIFEAVQVLLSERACITQIGSDSKLHWRDSPPATNLSAFPEGIVHRGIWFRRLIWDDDGSWFGGNDVVDQLRIEILHAFEWARYGTTKRESMIAEDLKLIRDLMITNQPGTSDGAKVWQKYGEGTTRVGEHLVHGLTFGCQTVLPNYALL